MKHRIILALSIFLAAPALAAQTYTGQGFDNQGDGTSTYSIGRVPNDSPLGWCMAMTATQGNPNDPSTVTMWGGVDGPDGDALPDQNGTCNVGGIQGFDWVTLGVCTQQEADDGDPLPTMELTCSGGQQTSGICPDTDYTTLFVPDPQSCAAAFDRWLRRWGKGTAERGWVIADRLLNAARPPAGAGDWEDPS